MSVNTKVVKMALAKCLQRGGLKVFTKSFKLKGNDLMYYHPLVLVGEQSLTTIYLKTLDSQEIIQLVGNAKKASEYYPIYGVNRPLYS